MFVILAKDTPLQQTMNSKLILIFTTLLYILVPSIVCYSQDFNSFAAEKDIDKKTLQAYDLMNNYVKKDLDSLLIVVKMQLHASNEVANRPGIICGWNGLGNVLIRKGRETEGIQYLRKVKNYYLEVSDFMKVAECLNEIGNGYVYMGKHQDAVEWYLQSLEYANLITEYAKGADINLAQAYLHLQEYEKAIEYAENHRDYNLKTTNYRNVANAFAVIGKIEMAKGNNERAIYNFEQSYQFCSRDPDNVMLGHTFNNLGIAYFMNGEVELSREAFLQGLAYRQKVNNTRLICDSYNNIASLYLELEEYNTAINYAQKGMDLAKKNDLLDSQMELLQLMKDIYSVYDIEQLPPILTEMEVVNRKLERKKEEQFSFDEEMKLELENSIALAQSGFKKPIYETIFIIGGIILLVIFGYIIFNINQRKQSSVN